MNRPTRFASRTQGQTRQVVMRSPAVQTDGGRILAGTVNQHKVELVAKQGGAARTKL